MPLISTVIFDMYDTLVRNNTDLLGASFKRIIVEQGLSATAEQLWEHWHPVAENFRNRRVEPDRPFQSYYNAWEEGFRKAFSALDQTGDAYAATDQFFADLSKREPFPETADALRQVQSSHRTAVLSNADDGFLLPNLKLLDLEFERVLSSEKARVYKPLPGLFEEMLRALNVKPEAAVYVGDRQFEDVLGASRVGMHTVWINRGDQSLDPQLPEPTRQIASLTELPALLADEFAT